MEQRELPEPHSTFDPVTVTDPSSVRNFGVITGAEAARIFQAGVKLHLSCGHEAATGSGRRFVLAADALSASKESLA
ncbi:MAG: hypothetical protein R2748_03165 [Bryobacterales bacterium]